MPAGSEVRPKRWSKVLDLYDDGAYSAIWGTYKDTKTRSVRCLGVRYNRHDASELGYPSQGKYPSWYVEPPIMTGVILEQLHSLVEQMTENPRKNGWLDNIRTALDECAKTS